jgi:hypothetical protein
MKKYSLLVIIGLMCVGIFVAGYWQFERNVVETSEEVFVDNEEVDAGFVDDGSDVIDTNDYLDEALSELDALSAQ